MVTNRRAVSEFERADRGRTEASCGAELSTQVQCVGQAAQAAVDDDSAASTDRQTVTDVALLCGECAEWRGYVDRSTEHERALLRIAVKAELAFERRIAHAKRFESARCRTARGHVDAFTVHVHHRYA